MVTQRMFMCPTYLRVVFIPPLVISLASFWGGMGSAIASDTMTIAQVVPDGSLSTIVTSSDDLNFAIDGGDRAGNNLFHSFGQFSIPTNGSARFNNTDDINIIINRITGGQRSAIDGLMQTNGRADLFLINPSGIVFGPNARLDIGGSLITTTADSIVFADGTEFSATDPTTPPLLSIETPIGLQMGTNPGAIVLTGSGHTLTQPNDLAPVLGEGTQLGLDVPPGQTIGLIGGEIDLIGANVVATGGQIELGSVRQGVVTLEQGPLEQGPLEQGPLEQGLLEQTETSSAWQFSYDEVDTFGNIHLSQRSLLNVSGAPAGMVEVWGDRIWLENGSIILSQNSGSTPARNITINANTRLTIAGMAPNSRFRSAIQTAANLDSLAQGGSINIETPRLRVQDRAAVLASTFGPGLAGHVNINATDRVDILGGVANPAEGDLVDSIVGAITVFNDGDAGDIWVRTPHLNLVGGLISTSTIAGAGAGGDIRIEAGVITLSGTSASLTIPGITAATFGAGNGGDVTINTRTLELHGGNLVDASSTAAGDAGNVDIFASEKIMIGMIGGQQANAPSLISSRVLLLPDDIQRLFGVDLRPTGQAGRITLETPHLDIGKQGNIITSVEGENVDNSAGGDIRIITDMLRIDNGLINASASQSGRGGNITIRANEQVEMVGPGGTVLINDIIIPALEGRFDRDSLTQGIVAIAEDQGQAGTIKIQTPDLQLQQGSVIATVTFTENNGGDIRIEGGGQVTIDESVITTSTLGSGQAGNMTIQTGELRLQNGAQILASTGGTGAAGNLDVRATDQIILAGSIEANTQSFASGLAAGNLNEATGNSGDILLITPLLVIRDGAELSVSALNDGTNPDSGSNPGNFQAGNIHATIGTLILDNGAIAARSTQGEGGNIFLALGDRLQMQNQSIISTQAGTEASGGGNGGNMDLTAPFIIATNNSDIIANAFVGEGGNIQITTQGLFGIAFRNMLTSASDITASSTFGVNGTVTIQTPDIDPASETTRLPASPSDDSQQITTGCEQISDSRFIVTGRGGVPLGPAAALPWSSLLEDLGPLPEQHNGSSQQLEQDASMEPSNQRSPRDAFMTPVPVPVPVPEIGAMAQDENPIQEANQMAIGPDGTITLIASHALTPPIGNFTSCRTPP